jgi:transposase InsO family protein
MNRWHEKTGIPTGRLLHWAGIARSTWHSWQHTYGKVREATGWVPRDFWLEPWEREAIVAFALQHPLDGYRRICYMMLDQGLVAVSPSSTYRVMKTAGLLQKWNRKKSKKGSGFTQPLHPHKHWHIDISYINICSTFYYLCSVLDGYSRYIVHWEIRESMKETDVEIILQRAQEQFPEAHPRIISDNGPQFISRDFKEFIRECEMTHVRTSPYYPQSNGKMERWYRSLKEDCIRTGTPLSLDDARRVVDLFVDEYNNRRLHSAIGYITPADKLAGRAEYIFKERERKLHEARQQRRRKRRATEEALTSILQNGILTLPGKTEAGSVGEQPARDSRLRFRHTPAVGEEATNPTAGIRGVDSSHASENPDSPKADQSFVSGRQMSNFR